MGILRKYRDSTAVKKQCKAYVDEGDKLSESWKTATLGCPLNVAMAMRSQKQVAIVSQV